MQFGNDDGVAGLRALAACGIGFSEFGDGGIDGEVFEGLIPLREVVLRGLLS